MRRSAGERPGTSPRPIFVAVFPGNISQYVHRRDGVGLDTDGTRCVRPLFQPLLVAWALWSTGVPKNER